MGRLIYDEDLMAQIIFVAVGCIGLLYFFWRRIIDPMAVAYGSCLIYFAPGFLGRVGFSYGSGELAHYAAIINPVTYTVMCVPLICLVLVALLHSAMPGHDKKIHLYGSNYIPEALCLIGVLSALMSVRNVGAYYTCVEKDLTLQHIDVYYYYAAYSLPTAFVAALAMRKYILCTVVIFFLLADVYAGFRAEIAMALIGVLLIFGEKAFESKKKALVYLVGLLVIGASLFIIKEFIWQLKHLGSDICHSAVISKLIDSASPELSAKLESVPLDKVGDKFASDLEVLKEVHAEADRTNKSINTDEIVKEVTRPVQSMAIRFDSLFSYAGSLQPYINAFTSAEPFVTVSTLNAVAETGFKTKPDYLIGQLLSGVPGGKSIFGIDVSEVPTFNMLVQKVLFPTVPFGMANNPWAQALAAGGLGLVIVFGMAYASMALILTIIFNCTHGALRAIVSVIAAWSLFYFHRNDLLTQIGILKHVIYLLLAAFLLSSLWELIMTKFARCQRPFW